MPGPPKELHMTRASGGGVAEGLRPPRRAGERVAEGVCEALADSLRMEEGVLLPVGVAEGVCESLEFSLVVEDGVPLSVGVAVEEAAGTGVVEAEGGALYQAPQSALIRPLGICPVKVAPRVCCMLVRSHCPTMPPAASRAYTVAALG
jgi:hypothetical protein